MGRLVRIFPLVHSAPTLMITLSSQSVARTNGIWSNDIKRGPGYKRGRSAGGFAGREDLEATRKYRTSNEDDDRGGYGMVFDVPRDRPSRKHDKYEDDRRRRSRSRSPRERRHKDKDYRDRDYRRERSPGRGDRHRERDRERDRDRARY